MQRSRQKESSYEKTAETLEWQGWLPDFENCAKKMEVKTSGVNKALLLVLGQRHLMQRQAIMRQFLGPIQQFILCLTISQN